MDVHIKETTKHLHQIKQRYNISENDITSDEGESQQTTDIEVSDISDLSDSDTGQNACLSALGPYVSVHVVMLMEKLQLICSSFVKLLIIMVIFNIINCLFLFDIHIKQRKSTSL